MKARKITFFLWILLITGGISIYIFFPEKLSLLFLQEISKNDMLVIFLIYYLVVSLRGLTFIPSSPLLLAGVLIFDPVKLFIINLAAILTSSTIVYYFSKYLGFDVYFETKYKETAQKIRKKLMDKELPIIVGWSFFPLTPTDLVVYVGSTLRVSVFKCLFGVLIGEAVLTAFYITTATMILQNTVP
ncbi:MAG: VTT domain-containing protein [Methanosarcina sp.]